MKKLVFATLMCLAAMSAKAQVLTSKTVSNVYEQVSSQTESDYAFNAERTAGDITTMYVYQKTLNRKGEVSQHPHLKYAYEYAADGTLASRVTYRWSNSLRDWLCASRYDYTLEHDSYRAEYSRYNHQTDSFDQPVERMVYTLFNGDMVNCVSCYHRERPTSPFQLDCQVAVSGLPQLFAGK